MFQQMLKKISHRFLRCNSNFSRLGLANSNKPSDDFGSLEVSSSLESGGLCPQVIDLQWRAVNELIGVIRNWQRCQAFPIL